MVQWYRTAILEDELNTLREKSNFKGAVQVFLHLLLILFSGTLSYIFLISGDWFLAILSLWFHGVFYSFLGWSGAGHELIHYSVFKSKALNRFFLKLFSFLSWNNYIYFKASHTRHHDFTLYRDLDQEIKLPQSLEYSSWIWWLTFNFPQFYKTLKTTIENSLGIIRGEWGRVLFLEENSPKKEELFSWARFVLIGHIFLVILFIVTGNWPLIFIVTLAPFIANWTNRVLALSQHLGKRGDVSDFRINSRSVKLDPFLSFLYWQMNYHIEHHMYPDIPFYNLKKFSKLAESDLPKPTNGFISMLKEMASMQKMVD